eukprot:TRINITY_DN3165_c0_g1_i1.p1 TRINITY_DN3165_c0_g1~~TRINITY_DN3165_c0_g1_i1.p1  ORF type:complete len:67 (-),score=13.38 TRINITY_DN3165_c0_g1_i1:248-448(-)
MGDDYNAMNMFMAFWCAAFGGLYAFWLFGQEVKAALNGSAKDQDSAAPINPGDDQYVIDNATGVKA